MCGVLGVLGVLVVVGGVCGCVECVVVCARHEHLYPTSDQILAIFFCAPAGSLGLFNYFNYFKLLNYYYKMDQINLGACESLPSEENM